jgi:hypothetical protein
MFRLCTLASILAISGCYGGEERSQTIWVVTHFELNRDAFKALEEALLSDPDVESVIACPKAGDRSCFIRVEPASAEELAHEAKFEPLIQALNFPRSVFFERRGENIFHIPNMGASTKGDYDIYATLWLRSERTPDMPLCIHYTPIGYRYECRIELDESWSLEWTGPNMKMFRACHDYEISRDEFNKCIGELEAEALEQEP